jgi:methylated-DNA-protein-cysteine methyltransferase-like protein
MQSFAEQVYEIVARIPKGKVVTYGSIARMLGKPRGAREVGWAMRNCPEGYPWQRVVMADGSITGGGYAEMRRDLLESEGVVFTGDGKVDMKECRWNE